MKRLEGIQPGVAVNQDEVVKSIRERGYYNSGIPRAGGKIIEGKQRGLSTTELVIRYGEAVLLGRKEEFVKSLSIDQFNALAALIMKGDSK